MQRFSPSDPNTLDSHRKRCLVLELDKSRLQLLQSMYSARIRWLFG
jgi:hypothetical protein